MNPYIHFNPNPFCDSLTSNWRIIKSELYEFMHRNGITHSNALLVGEKPNALGTLYSGNFKSLCVYIKSNMLDKFEMKALSWKPDEKERWNPYFSRSPFFMNFLYPFISGNKENIGSCVFNISYPGSELRHHFGLDPEYMRLHLCIQEDKDCIFDIENNRHVWKDGELFGFDDANVLHGTKHYSQGLGPRIIMLMDVKKEFLKPFAQTWPCRTSRPKVSELPPLKGWDNTVLKPFVANNNL